MKSKQKTRDGKISNLERKTENFSSEKKNQEKSPLALLLQTCHNLSRQFDKNADSCGIAAPTSPTSSKSRQMSSLQFSSESKSVNVQNHTVLNKILNHKTANTGVSSLPTATTTKIRSSMKTFNSPNSHQLVSQTSNPDLSNLYSPINAWLGLAYNGSIPVDRLIRPMPNLLEMQNQESVSASQASLPSAAIFPFSQTNYPQLSSTAFPNTMSTRKNKTVVEYCMFCGQHCPGGGANLIIHLASHNSTHQASLPGTSMPTPHFGLYDDIRHQLINKWRTTGTQMNQMSAGSTYSRFQPYSGQMTSFLPTVNSASKQNNLFFRS